MKTCMIDWENRNIYNLTKDNEYENFWNEVHERFAATANLNDMIDLFLSEHFDNDVVDLCEELELNSIDWRNEVLETEAWNNFYDSMVLEFINDTYERFHF